MDRLDVSQTASESTMKCRKMKMNRNLDLWMFFHGWFRDVEVVFPFPKVEDGLVLKQPALFKPYKVQSTALSTQTSAVDTYATLTSGKASNRVTKKKASDKWGVKN